MLSVKDGALQIWNRGHGEKLGVDKKVQRFKWGIQRLSFNCKVAPWCYTSQINHNFSWKHDKHEDIVHSTMSTDLWFKIGNTWV